MERVEVERGAVDAADRGCTALVPRGSGGLGNRLGEACALAVGSAHVADRAETLRQVLARRHELVQEYVGLERRQVRVGARVRPDLVAELDEPRGTVPVERLDREGQVQ